MPIACASRASPRRGHVVDQRALGDLQLQPRRLHPGLVEHRLDLADQLEVAELPARDVDAHDARRLGDRSAAATPPSAGTIRARTSRPICRIMPVSSAIGMNSAGPTSPRVGWRQRTSASNPAIAPVRATRSADSAPRTPVLDGVAQVGFHLQTRDRPLAHGRVEDFARPRRSRPWRDGARSPRRAALPRARS